MVGFQRLVKYATWLAGLLLAGMVLLADAAEDFGPSDAKKLIAMVESTAGDQREVGAGIILGRGPADSVYIVTAYHVAFPDGEEADEILVKFRFLPGETKRAMVLDIRDVDLDYAVIKVEDIAPVLLDTIAFNRVRASGDLENGAELFTIGNPGGEAWYVAAVPDSTFQRTTAGMIKFNSEAVQVGHSGGGLFTKDWYLVGMIRTDDSVQSIAVSIETLFEELRYQGIESDLAMARPKIIAFSTKKSTITAGERTILSWDVKDAHTVMLDGIQVTGTSKSVIPSGSNKRYTLSVQDKDGKEWDAKTVVVEVQSKQAPGQRTQPLIVKRPTPAIAKGRTVTSILTGGTYTIQQKSNGRYVDAHQMQSEDYRLVTRPRQNNDTQRWIVKSLGKNTYTIQQKSNNRYVDAHEKQSEDYRLVTRPRQNNDTQRWIIRPVENNVYTIQQKSNGRYVDAHEMDREDYRLVTRKEQKNDTQMWVFKKL